MQTHSNLKFTTCACEFLQHTGLDLRVPFPYSVEIITLPQLSNFKSKKLSTFNGSNLHLIINFIMFIENLFL